MGRVCIIRRCQIKNEPEKKKFSIPKNPERREKWIKALKKHVRDEDMCRKARHVCADHFRGQDFSKYRAFADEGALVPNKSAVPDDKNVTKWLRPHPDVVCSRSKSRTSGGAAVE